MGKHFAKIRRKTRVFALMSAAILGIGVGVITVAALVLTLKLLEKPIELWYYFFGAGTMLVSAMIAYFVFMPSEKRLAKRLDEEHSLGEKVRTMVEFKHSDDMFACLQREDADEKLGATRVNHFRKRQFIAAILVFAVSVGFMTGAVLVPEKEQLAETEAPISEYDKQLILADLSDIIAAIKDSPISEQLKESAVGYLSELVEVVKATDYMSEMKSKAIDTVLSINRALFEENTASRIGEAMERLSTPALVSFGESLSGFSVSGVKGALEELEKMIETDGTEKAMFAADEIASAMSGVNASATNPTVSIVNSLASRLRDHANGEISLDAVFTGVYIQLVDELAEQNANKIKIQEVTSRLCTLFGITASELAEYDGGETIDTRPPSSITPEEEIPPEVEDPNGDVQGGGMGDGLLIYGSNDMIYNPYTDTYVAYGEILTEYNAKANEKIIDGVITEEFAEFIQEYFKQLAEYKPENED